MKKLLKYTLGTLFAAALVSATLHCFAQAPAALNPASAPPAATAASWIASLAAQHPIIVTIFTVIGLLRTIFKPVMTAIENAVANSPVKSKALADFEAGPIFHVISWLLDFGASIKLKPSIVSSAASSAATGIALVIAILSIGLCMPLVGCKATPGQIAYRTVGSTQVTVDAAMHEWGAYVKAVHPTVAQEQAVADAYEKYQNAMAAVCDAGAIYAASTQTNSAGASGFQAALETAIANANTSISDLESLIASFGVHLQ